MLPLDLPNPAMNIRNFHLEGWLIFRRFSLVKALLMGIVGFLILYGPGSVQATEPTVVTATATLSVLAGPVELIPAGSTESHGATDGMSLNDSDRIVTGTQATALVTFLDGSTLIVQPDSDVEVKRAEVHDEGSRISIGIHLGTVWARVVQLMDRQSTFSLESNTATATVHDGLIGGQKTSDHNFTCWTMAGDLLVKDRKGQLLVTLKPGEKTSVQDGQDSGRHAFAVHQSTLKVTASPNVFPLVSMPDHVRVSGFVAPGLEVNQVFGSRTGMEGYGTRTIEVPAGVPGPFTLIVEGKADTSFTVTVEGFYKGLQVYRRNFAGTISKGERLSTSITQELESAPVSNPKTAKVLKGRAEDLRSLQEPLPGIILVSPHESKRLTELAEGAIWSLPRTHHSNRLGAD
jgi:FecR-like protein